MRIFLKLFKTRKKLEELGKLSYEYIKENHDWKVLSENLLINFENILRTILKKYIPNNLGNRIVNKIYDCIRN